MKQKKFEVIGSDSQHPLIDPEQLDAMAEVIKKLYETGFRIHDDIEIGIYSFGVFAKEVEYETSTAPNEFQDQTNYKELCDELSDMLRAIVSHSNEAAMDDASFRQFARVNSIDTLRSCGYLSDALMKALGIEPKKSDSPQANQ